MPLRDGTGPLGLGSGSGRGRGWGGAGIGFRNIPRLFIRGRQGWVLGIAASLVAAIVRDLLNPSGVLRRITNTYLNTGVTGNNQKMRKEAVYTVVDANSVPILQKKDDR